MMDLISPLESARFVMNNAKHVKICDEGIQHLSKLVLNSLQDKNCNYFNYKSFDLNPKDVNEKSFNQIFLVNSLNFSFWSQLPKQNENKKKVEYQFKVNYKGKSYTGYWALCAAINRAIDDGYPITDSKFYANISESDLKKILRSDSSIEIPLFEERLRVMRETGSILNEKFDGDFTNCIKAADKSAKRLLEIIVNNFPSYRDEAMFMDRKITFYKRAQVLVGDIWAFCDGDGIAKFNDIDELTMLADYRVPQVLRFFKALDYSKELHEFLKADNLMKTGDLYEVEIRAASILACNLITQTVRKYLIDANLNKIHVNDILVDRFIWNYRRDYADEIEAFLPCHKIRCIFY